MKKIFALLLTIFLIIGLLYYFKTGNNLKSDDNNLILHGNVDIREIQLGFRISGRLEKMYYEEGDTVKKDDLLAVLDKIPQEEILNIKKAQIKEIEVNLINAEKTYQRQANLKKRKTISESDYDDALAKRNELQARLATAQAQVVQAQTQLEDSYLKAPQNGIILTRVEEPGTILAAGRTVYTLALESPVWIRTYIDELNLEQIYPGQKVIINTDTGQKYEGQIGFISPQAEFTPKTVESTQLRTYLVYRLRIIVENPNVSLRQGMPVSIIVPPKN